MEFNVKKCKVLHVGRSNRNFAYLMNGEKLDAVDSERDIGVIIDKSMKPSLQCAEAAGEHLASSSKSLEPFFTKTGKLF